MQDSGSLIRDARRSAGLSQAALARRLGLSQPAVAKLESRDSNPTIRTLRRALRATGRDLELLARPGQGWVDMSLIREHLRLSPAERLRGLEVMIDEAATLAAAGARARARRA